MEVFVLNRSLNLMLRVDGFDEYPKYYVRCGRMSDSVRYYTNNKITIIKLLRLGWRLYKGKTFIMVDDYRSVL